MEDMHITRLKMVAFIEGYHRHNHCAPSYRDIGSALGISARRVSQLLPEMTEQGYLSYKPGLARTVSVTDKGFKLLQELQDKRKKEEGE